MNRKRLLWIITPFVIIFILLLVILLIIYNPVIRDEFTSALSMEPEPLTELYFEDHLDLANEVTLLEENSFSFTIHNLENKDINYEYKVFIVSENGEYILEEDSVFIKADEFSTIEVKYIVEMPAERLKVVVDLPDFDQDIAFWIEEVIDEEAER
jgi:hypothetical protein